MKISDSSTFFEDHKFMSEGVDSPFKSQIQGCTGPNIMVRPHFHTFIEILYCTSGRFNLFLDGKGYTFTEGDMVVINAMEVHYTLSASEGVNQYVVILFEPELLYTTSQNIFEAKYVLPFTMKTSIHQKIFTKAELSDTFIPELLLEIPKEDAVQGYGYELAIRTHIGRIFLWILRYWHEKGLDLNLGASLNITTMERLRQIFDYVEDHYSQPLSINDGALLCSMSYSYFSRFFKAAMGRNFSDYVNFVRVTKAEDLLAASDLNITEIAQMVGFSTSSYFIEQFKAYKNMTPRQFRHNFKEMAAG